MRKFHVFYLLLLFLLEEHRDIPAEYIFDLLVEQLLDLNELLLTELFLGALSAFLGKLEESLLLLEVITRVLRVVLGDHKLHEVLNVGVAQGKLVDVEADELADLRASKATFLDDCQKGDREDCRPADNNEATEDVGSKDLDDLQQVLLGSELCQV